MRKHCLLLSALRSVCEKEKVDCADENDGKEDGLLLVATAAVRGSATAAEHGRGGCGVADSMIGGQIGNRQVFSVLLFGVC